METPAEVKNKVRNGGGGGRAVAHATSAVRVRRSAPGSTARLERFEPKQRMLSQSHACRRSSPEPSSCMPRSRRWSCTTRCARPTSTRLGPHRWCKVLVASGLLHLSLLRPLGRMRTADRYRTSLWRHMRSLHPAPRPKSEAWIHRPRSTLFAQRVHAPFVRGMRAVPSRRLRLALGRQDNRPITRSFNGCCCPRGGGCGQVQADTPHESALACWDPPDVGFVCPVLCAPTRLAGPTRP